MLITRVLLQKLSNVCGGDVQCMCRPSMFNVRDVRDSTFVSSLDVRARDVLQLVVKRRPMVQRSC